MGAALYAGGGNKIVLSYGTHEADIGHRYPPGACGDLVLQAYCPPAATTGPQGMVSPLLSGVRQQDEMPQIAAPPRGQSRTVFPGQRTGLDSVMPVLGLEPAPVEYLVEGQDEVEAPPPPPPDEPPAPSGPKSRWDRFETQR
jgi:hypothetical protein